MKKIHTGRFILVVFVASAALALVSLKMTEFLGVVPGSRLVALVGGALIGGGVIVTIVILNWLVRRGRIAWLERD